MFFIHGPQWKLLRYQELRLPYKVIFLGIKWCWGIFVVQALFFSFLAFWRPLYKMFVSSPKNCFFILCLSGIVDSPIEALPGTKKI